MVANSAYTFSPFAGGTLDKINPLSDETWTQLVSEAPLDLFHSPRWMKVISETFEINVRACIIRRNGKPVAGVSWSDLDDMFGPRRVTLPFSDYSDIICNSTVERNAVVEYLLDAGIPWIARSHDTALIPSDGWSIERKLFAHHVIDVEPDEDALFANLSSMARRNTRKSETAGVEIFEATSKDELRTWVDLHMGLRRHKYRLLAQPFSFFENIWDEFIGSGDGFVLLARLNGQIIAGTVYVISGDTCYYKFNASHPDGLKMRPNNALMWHGMLRAKQRGLKAIDLGRTNAAQQGLLDFKESYGGVRSEMVEYKFSPFGYQSSPVHVQNREVISGLTTILTDPEVPDTIIEQASALLYRYFA